MSGPTKKDKTLGERAESWELLALGAGLIVVVGLLVECGPELAHSLLHQTWPTHAVIGDVVVTLGVAAEVIFSWRAVNFARRAELEATQVIAKLNSETERLRKENNDTLILRGPRTVGNISVFREAMRPFGGTKYMIYIHEDDSNDAARLASELNTALVAAGWIKLENVQRRASLANWVLVKTVCKAPSEPYESAASWALADWLDNRLIAAIPRSGGEPNLETGTLTIEIGLLPETIEQYEQVRSEYKRHKESRPVTPPQA